MEYADRTNRYVLIPHCKANLTPYLVSSAHETATHAARLRVELSQSRSEQKDYLKNVELARVLAKRAERKRASQGADEAARVDKTADAKRPPSKKRDNPVKNPENGEKKRRRIEGSSNTGAIDDVLSQVF